MPKSIAYANPRTILHDRRCDLFVTCNVHEGYIVKQTIEMGARSAALF
jgi:hypothetical protein